MNIMKNLKNKIHAYTHGNNLSSKIIVAGSLSSIETFIITLMRLISTLIVTRLLMPEIFGIFSIIMTFQTIMSMLTDFGIRSLILTAQYPRQPRFLRTCWSVQVVRGGVIYGVILCLSGALYVLQANGILIGGSVYGAAVLPAALAASGFQVVLQGLQSVNLDLYAREMRFRLITLLNISTAAIGMLLTISIAFVEPSVWALVISGLLTWTLKSWLTHILFKGPRMGFCWDKTHRKMLFSRGKWIMGRSSLHVVAMRADQLLLSAFLPSTLFGIYFLAKQIFTLPEALMQKLHGAFGLQFFREIITRPAPEMRRRYYKYRIPMDAVACIFAGGFLTAAPAVIEFMYDPRYAEAGFILQVLGIGLPLFGMGMIREGFGAQQRFKITAVFGLIQAITIWAGMLVALVIFESPLAAFVVIALHRVPELATLLFCARREGWIDLLNEFRMFPLIGVGALLGLGLSALIYQVI